MIYASPEGFAVIIVKTEDAEIKATGMLAGVEAGEEVLLEGEMENSKYGRQFSVSAWSKTLPTTAETAVEFLASGLIPGVRRKTAEKIVAHLGENAVHLICKHGEEVLENIKGLGKKKAVIVQAVREKYEINVTISQLTALGITATTAVRIYRRFGPAAPQIIKYNPYALTEVELIGFHKADEIAKMMGMAPDSIFRARAGLLYLLTEALFTEGHTYITKDMLKQRADRIKLTFEAANQQALAQLQKENKIYIENDRIGLAKAYRIEKEIAGKLKRLNRPADRNLVSRYSAVLSTLPEAKMLTDTQKRAVLMAATSGFSVLTGGPGVGKTFTVKTVVDLYRQINPEGKIALVAPTGRAAKRLEELVGHPAETVHRLLGWKKQEVKTSEGIKEMLAPEYHRDNPLPHDLIIVDEASMLDIFMTRFLLDAVKPAARVLFVGDPDQLPSVGPGNVLKDILSSGIPRTHLSEVFRQDGKSRIVINAQKIRNGEKKLESGNDFCFLKAENGEEAKTKILQAVQYLSQYGEVQVLSPVKKGPCGTRELNQLLQKALNPNTGGLTFGSQTFKIGDKVIQCKNDYYKGVMNGEVGFVKNVDPDEETLEVEFAQGTVSYSREDLKNLELAYAITVHKSQGSEYDYVVIPVLIGHYIMLYRNLLYTAVTRAKKGIVLVGQPKAVFMAINRIKAQKRNTRLGEFLQEEENLFSTASI